MTITTIDGLRMMTPDSGNWLVKDDIYSKMIYLGVDVNPSDWQEVSDAYYRSVTDDVIMSRGTINKFLDATITPTYTLPNAVTYDHFDIYIQKTDSNATPLNIVGMIMGEPVPLDNQGNHVTYTAKDGYWYVKENN